MKVLGIIPSRFQSSRFPGKPLIDLKGKSMIQRVYEGASKSNFINQLVVATDDSRIFDEVVRFGGNVLMTKNHHQSGTDRCGEVLEKHPNFDVVLNIQGDEPLVDFRQIDLLLSAFKDNRNQIVTLASKNISMEEIKNPNRIKIVVNKDNEALYFSRSIIPNFDTFTRNPLENYPYLKHIGLYGFRKETLQQIVKLKQSPLEVIESLEQLRWMYYGYPIKIIETSIETPNIDTPEDVKTVINLLK
jgi:3-deoxy-manno-octulosonate cytidylyltransferase (CMP-KDO synthetase)